MSTARQELRSYVERLRGRLRVGAILRGTVVLAASALLATIVLVALANAFAFSRASLWSARGVLWVTLLLGAALGLALPLWRLTHRMSARRAERTFPQFEQRLLTFAERERADDPFIELLAADTLRIARSASPKRLLPDAALAALAGLGIACIAVLVWLVRAGPGYWGYGAAALWTGTPPAPLYDIHVIPGDATVRRHGDQLITALPLGVQPPQVRLYARFRSASKWDSVAMAPQPRGPGYQFLLAGIPEDVDYYIEAGRVRSSRFHLRVADVPVVEQIRVTLHYPAWTKLADAVDEHGGDVRAVAGTAAQLDVVTDRPLASGLLVLDDGREVALVPEAPPTGGAAGRDFYRGVIDVERDGAYHVAARDAGTTLRISEDYFIEAAEVKPPEVAIVRPMRDYLANPIEEVTIAAQAADAFGLQSLALHYSVNGGPEKVVPLLKEAGEREASGSTVISLESLKLVPGDVVSLYAAAKDARAESRTDIAFVQVEPFEREFSQSQQAGGGGGGFGSGETQIAEREKEIIAATWRQAGMASPAPKQSAEQAKFLSDAQSTLRAQSLALAGRLQLRDLTSANEEIGRFQQEMNAAAAAMGPAAEKLGGERWNDAVPAEQQALQHLLRAEATFRQIEVAFGSMGGGGGAVNSAGRDLASLFDLELDMQKNQYETRQDASSMSGRSNEVDDILRRLDEVARRQQALADQPPGSLSSAEQRWQEEMLRRNAEELRREIEQLSRQTDPLARNDGPQGQAGAMGQASGMQGGAGGAAAGSSRAAAQAASRMRQAEEEMRQAVDQHDEAGARRAAERLREAMNDLGGIQQQQSEGQLAALKREAARLANEEHQQAQRLQAAARGAGEGADPLQELIDERQKLADDLSRLEAGMRNAERDALPRSRDAASRVRDALNDLDQADTETQLQRSADMLRRGYLNGNDSQEGEIESSLQHLTDQLGEAGAALARGGGAPANDALDSVERLRGELAGIVGPVRAGGAGGTGLINGGWNSGDNRVSTGAAASAAPTAPPPGVDPERSFRQSLSEVEKLRRSVADDPQSRRQVDALIKAMQGLDPRRFPGNPAMVDELYGRVLSEVDRLELQLRREPAGTEIAEVRSDRPLDVPPGYQDSVSEYYRRLSQAAR